MSLNHPLATAGYVPYTPRQHRPQQRQALLRTAAQSIGLDGASLGWALLDRLVSEPGWTDIWQPLALGRATLLLPTTAYSDRTPINQELIKDHVAFVDVAANQLVTLSALRAVLCPDSNPPTLVFRSALHPSSAVHVHRALPPLPLPNPRGYPTYTLLSPLHTQLSVPATAPNTLKQPPPLPPRPVPASTSGTSTPHRLPNPFASLFRTTTPPPPPPPAASAPTSTETGDGPISTLTISVLLIDKPVLRSDIAKQVNTALRGEISRRFGADADANSDIDSAHIPAFLAQWVVTFVHEFALGTSLYPFSPRSRSHARTGGNSGGRDLTKRLEVAIAGTGRSSSRQGHRRPREEEGKEEGIDGGEEEEEEYDIALWPNTGAENARGADLEDLVMAFQDFYAELEREARSKIHQDQEREREQAIDGPYAAADATSSTDVADATDSLVARIVESAESTLCSLFYDRLFMHPSSDDTSHDATLSSRIAALNMVDITLDRLDMDVSAAREAGREDGVDEVVSDCGKALLRLESCRSPKDKAAVLVEAHKVVVDGLAKLPPIKLIPEEARVRGGGSDGEEMREIRRRVSTAAEPEAKPESGREGNSTPKPSPVSGDILLPFLIFSVVKSNPPHLVSHLLFTQRFRNTHLPFSIAGGGGGGGGGEESYCMINLMAVAEFLENVDLGALGVDHVDLSPSHHVPDVEGLLSPILKSPGIPKPSSTEAGEGGGGGPGLRDRMEQQVDAIGAIGASANKVLAGVMDTSFGILKSLIPGQQQGQGQTRIQVHAPLKPSPAPVPAQQQQQQSQPAAVVVKPGFGLLKRDNSATGGFSIATIASSLPIARVGSGSKLVGSGGGEEEMITVSRPGSIRSGSYPDLDPYAFGEEEGDEAGVDGRREENADMHGGGEGGGGGEEKVRVREGEGEGEGEGEADDRRKASYFNGSVRSIKSFESMLSEGKAKAKERVGPAPRKSLSDRLAGIKVGSSPPVSRPSSLLFPSTSIAPAASEKKEGGLIAPPVRRFLECAPDELRIGEVAELVEEYRRLVDAVRAMGGFAGRSEGDDYEY